MSPETDVEKGTAGRDTTANPTDDKQERSKPGPWDKFQPWPIESMSADERRDPRVIAHLQTLVPGTAIFGVSLGATKLVLRHRIKQEHEAMERVSECSDYEGEEYQRRMEELTARHDARVKTHLGNMRLLAHAKPTRGAMASAAEILRRYDPESPFSHDANPNSARPLVQQNEVHRHLRMLLNNEYISPFLFWMPEIAPGIFDIDSMDATVEVVVGIAILLPLLVAFGVVLFGWVSGRASEIFLFGVAVVGGLVILVLENEDKHLMVLGLMAVMASIVSGGRDNACGPRTDL